MTGQQQKKLVTNEDSRDFILRCVRDRYPILYKTPGFSDIGRRLGVCSYLDLASWHVTRIQPERWNVWWQPNYFASAFSLTYGFCVVFAKKKRLYKHFTYSNFCLIGIQTFSWKKIRLKMSSAKCCSFRLGLNVLTRNQFQLTRINVNCLGSG